jgi:DNA replication licensing factor MCM5
VARFTALAREEGILAKIQASIAPKIFGAQDIKKAVACLLFGGCRKVGGHPWW